MIIGIIAAIVIVGLVSGFAIGGNNNQEPVLTESTDNDNIEESTGGRNITIELSDGLNIGSGG